MPLYIFQSSESIDSIREQINRHGKSGPIHIMRDRDSRETSLNYILLDEETASSVPGFRFRKYEFRDPNYPSQGYTWNLFINLCPNIPNISDQKKALNEKLQPLIDYGLFKNDDITIHIPIASREFNQSRGFAYIKFSPNIEHENIIIVKIFLDNSYWNHEGRLSLARCDWAKIPRKERHNELGGRSRYQLKSKSQKEREVTKIESRPINETTSPVQVTKDESTQTTNE